MRSFSLSFLLSLLLICEKITPRMRICIPTAPILIFENPLLSKQ